MNKLPIIATTTFAAFIAGCAQAPSLQLPALNLPTSAISTNAIPKTKVASVRRKPVVAERPARMYVWAGFKEKDCSPVAATMTVTKAPTKGAVTFRENQATTVQFSNSGKCIGQRMQGTGVFYVAAKGQDGGDVFTVTASTPNGQTVTKSFAVRIVE